MISKNLNYLVVISASIMLFVWGIPHTIALRNIIMGVGALCALFFLILYKPFIANWKLLPLAGLYSLLLWVIIHYFYFSQNPHQELLELKSLWLRVFAAMTIATAMGVLIRFPTRINGLFIAAFFSMSLVIILMYLFNSIKLDHLLSPKEFSDHFLFARSKVTTAFFSVIDFSVGCSSLCYLFYRARSRHDVLKSIAILILMGASMVASVIANSKNGVGICAIFAIFLLSTIIFSLAKNTQPKKLFLGLFIVLVTTSLTSILVVTHKKQATPGWDTLLADIEIAVQIDRYQSWRGVELTGEAYPTNKYGTVVAVNTYERFAWMMAGSREILRHPLGFGLINSQSFPRWLKNDNIKSNIESGTHSGWVDLGLSFGLPAIGIVLLSLLITAIGALMIKNKFFFSYLAIWISLAVLCAGIVQEITYQHTFEAMMFFATFSAACFASMNKKLSPQLAGTVN